MGCRTFGRLPGEEENWVKNRKPERKEAGAAFDQQVYTYFVIYLFICNYNKLFYYK